MNNPQVQLRLQQELDAKLSDWDDTPGSYSQFSHAVYDAAASAVGFRTRHNKDWFDDQDTEARSLLNQMHSTHLQWINDKSCCAKRHAYKAARSQAQARLREMKEKWWAAKAVELQEAADRHDMKAFYDGLKQVYGPKDSGSAPVRSKDGTNLITDREEILARWAEHFQTVLNQPSTFDFSVLTDIPQWEEAPNLSCPPSQSEVIKAIKTMTSGKAPGADGLPPELFKNAGPHMARRLTRLFGQIWEQGEVPQEFKDAQIIHIFKRKGDRALCDDHRGISLLAIPGKILARVILNRLSAHVFERGILPESQCGFRAGRGTMDMIFTARQLQEKCREQNKDLFAVFIDLTKAFDSVNRGGLWAILHQIGCPEKLTNMIRSFHKGMRACVTEAGEKSDEFEVLNGTKQGCVLAPLLFSIFFSMMLFVAFRNCDIGIPIQFRTDGDVFNLRRLQAKSKVHSAIIRELLFADDCALMAHTLSDLQTLMNKFADAANRFGLTVSLKKTEVMVQESLSSWCNAASAVTVDDKALATVDKFTYLGSVLCNTRGVDNDISARLAKASSAFGRLHRRLWTEHQVKLSTKVAVYRAVVVSTLLYGCEAWTLYRHNIRKLDQFHMRCLRKIANIRWQEQVPNTVVLQKCGTVGIEAIIIASQLRWVGHIARMPDERIPKRVFYGQLSSGQRSRGRPLLRYKDRLKDSLKACRMEISIDMAQDRPAWRRACHEGVERFEKARISNLEEKRRQRKAPETARPAGQFACDQCGKKCGSRIGLVSHLRTHR